MKSKGWRGNNVFQAILHERVEKYRQCIKELNLNEISFEGKTYKIPCFNEIPLAGKSVEVRVNPNEWLKIFYRGYFLVQYDLKPEKKEDLDINKTTA